MNILDDAGQCTRCQHAKETRSARSLAGRAVAIVVVVLFALVAYRVASTLRDTGPSRRVATAAQPGSRLVVYTTTSCPACRLAKAWMEQNGVAYEERCVDVDQGAQRELLALGKGTVVPTFVVDDDVLVGFDVRGVRLTQALKAHGLRPGP